MDPQKVITKQPQIFTLKKVIQDYSYQLCDKIGCGYSSQVFKGKNEKSGEQIAIKVIQQQKLKNQTEKKLLKNEIKALKKLKNDFILQLLDCYQTQNNTYIITEFCNEGDLQTLLRKKGKINETEAVKIIWCIINGLQELFSKKIIHRDLKPANIFLKDGLPKIADLGFCIELESLQHEHNYNVGTPIYMSPEALKFNQYSYKSDIWSIGVIFYELLYGQVPFYAHSEKELAQVISSSNLQFPNCPSISDQAKDFMRKCLNPDLNQRIGSDEVHMHKLFDLYQQHKKIGSNFNLKQEGRELKNQSIENLTPQEKREEEETNNDRIFLGQLNFCQFLVQLYELTVTFHSKNNERFMELITFIIIKNLLIKVQQLHKVFIGKQNSQCIQNVQEYTLISQKYEKEKKLDLASSVEYYSKIYDTAYLALESHYQDYLDILGKVEFNQFSTQIVRQDQENQLLYQASQIFIMKIIKKLGLDLQSQFFSSQICPQSGNTLDAETETEITLLDYFATYYQILGLLIKDVNNYKSFVEKSKIEAIALGHPNHIQKYHYYQIMNKLKLLSIL